MMVDTDKAHSFTGVIVHMGQFITSSPTLFKFRPETCVHKVNSF
jgi:hypothetical protein